MSCYQQRREAALIPHLSLSPQRVVPAVEIGRFNNSLSRKTPQS